MTSNINEKIDILKEKQYQIYSKAQELKNSNKD